MVKALAVIVMAISSVGYSQGPTLHDDSKNVPLSFDKEIKEDLLNGQIGLTRWYYTKPLWSGKSKNFSAWYVIIRPLAPQGYKVFKTTFVTRGDRHCTGGDDAAYSKGRPPSVLHVQPLNVIVARDYAECELIGRNASQVIWRFRLQGHQDRDGYTDVEFSSDKAVSFSTKLNELIGVFRMRF